MISIAEPQRPALSSVTTSQFRSREALRPIVSLAVATTLNLGPTPNEHSRQEVGWFKKKLKTGSLEEKFSLTIFYF